MRTVKYDLCYNGIVIKETNNYEEAIKWKSESESNSYKLKLEEIPYEVSEKEKEWRTYFIAKKNAFRRKKIAMQNN